MMTLLTLGLVLQVAGLVALIAVWHRLAVMPPMGPRGPRRCGRCGGILPERTRRTHDGQWRCATCKGREA